ncbi:hypothetical protein PVAP13_3KG401502 [Panicum virgatum]|uniref:Rx N-terminal domain-containing protein n=1 Tax=Panicum virgatum TaxID=38727 RepID=A0A8T0UXS8_PANVG|nr:hypothetical protein PVAP13_3KG401502 [Panicum virgatum]
MAAQTQGAVDALLGLLSTAIKDEAKLMGGVPGNMQFIKDEMDSMNGFLTHLTKIEDEHDDQVRAWMKQVREIAYISEDCVERYVRDILPYLPGGGDPGFLYINTIRFLLRHPCKYCELHKLGNQLAELKLRVREVGQRRERYGVSVPEANKKPPVVKSPAAAAGAQDEEKRRDDFRRELEAQVLQQQYISSRAIDLFPDHHAFRRSKAKDDDKKAPEGGGDDDDDAKKILGRILEKCLTKPPPPPPDHRLGDEEAALVRMFLCALYASPYYTTNQEQELKNLDKKLAEKHDEANREQVMTFCYSMLSTEQKSCLQYLTAFLHEKEISRTSMVRRWVAERLVVKQVHEQDSSSTLEEAGERCFSELVFRGFVHPSRISDSGTIKSCTMEEPVRRFVGSITRSENFLLHLPSHLERQLKIREIVQGRPPSSLPPPLPPPQHPLPLSLRLWNAVRCIPCTPTGLLLPPEEDASSTGGNNPMDKLVDFLEDLPDLYRLNVLDLGGCKGLQRRHIRSFRKLVWLRYLSLRDTDVHRYYDAASATASRCSRYINRLTLLETLDIRGTNIPPGDTKRIYLPNLKHLLADRRRPDDDRTPKMPSRIGWMKSMQTLSHVRISKEGTELEGVVRLRSAQQLRKLGVVVHGNKRTAEYLSRVLYALAPCLRSLSIWVITNTQTQPLDIPTIQAESSMVLENLDIKGNITSLPSWIGSRAHTQSLANVTLRDTEISAGEALRRLASVPGLRCLKLVGEAFAEQVIVFGKDVQFKALRILVVEGSDAFTASRLEFSAAPPNPKQEKIAADSAALAAPTTPATATVDPKLEKTAAPAPKLEKITTPAPALEDSKPKKTADADPAPSVAPKLEKIVWAVGGGGGGSSSRTMKKGYNDRQQDITIISGIKNIPSLKTIELRGDFNVPKLLDWTTKATSDPRCLHVSSSDRKILIDKVSLPTTGGDTLSLPVGVINMQ